MSLFKNRKKKKDDSAVGNILPAENEKDLYYEDYEKLKKEHEDKPCYIVPYVSKRERRRRMIREIIFFFLPLIMLFLLLYVIFCLGIVPTESMSPYIKGGDVIIANRLSYKLTGPARGDIVLFKRNGSYMIKRVIGLPGEEISLRDGRVYLYESVLMEDCYLENDQNFTLPYDDGNEMTVFSVPEDSYFVLGDNRAASADSRYWKEDVYIGRKSILGRVFFRLRLSPKETGIKEIGRISYEDELLEDGNISRTDIKSQSFLGEDMADPESVVIETLPVDYEEAGNE